jgi:hypothetical protein
MGRIIKKIQNRERWSPSRVGVRVINSLNARNDVRANKMIEPIPPVAMARPKTATIIHHARVRAFRFLTVALPDSLFTCNDNIQPMSDAMRRMARTPPTSQIVC